MRTTLSPVSHCGGVQVAWNVLKEALQNAGHKGHVEGGIRAHQGSAVIGATDPPLKPTIIHARSRPCLTSRANKANPPSATSRSRPRNISWRPQFVWFPILCADRRSRGQGNASCAVIAAFRSDRGFGVIPSLCTSCLNILTMTRLHPKGGAIARVCDTHRSHALALLSSMPTTHRQDREDIVC